jgi:hypothetical protein
MPQSFVKNGIIQQGQMQGKQRAFYFFTDRHFMVWFVAHGGVGGSQTALTVLGLAL